MKILFLGDIVSDPGRKAVVTLLPKVKDEVKPDVVIANVENMVQGRGINDETLKEMQTAGIDYFTSGDHVFWQKNTDEILDREFIVRPANYPVGIAGKGHHLLDLGAKGSILIINLMGRTFLNDRLDDPFRKIDEILAEYEGKDIQATFVDFHAEATSEKLAFAFYVDGRVDAVVGTHTHVPTSDTMVLPKGTLYVTDAGMNGNIDSVLGVKKEIIINLFMTAQNQRFEWEDTGRIAFRSVFIDTEAKEIKRIDYLL
jgi:metallophosphoesterase (TIGR00282 family)